ncbi:MAG TPA: hypothetical protein VF221_04100 [Chloroflexota bacterium]
MQSGVTALGLVFVLSVSVVVPSLAQATTGRAAVAFQGAYRGTASMPGTGLPMREKIVAVGRAALLGVSTLRSTATSAPPNPGGCIAFSGRGRLTTAGGSWLTYRYSYVPCFRPSPPFPHDTGRGHYTITGGGGRLRGARGNGTYVARFPNNPSGFQAPPGEITITFRGSLRTP